MRRRVSGQRQARRESALLTPRGARREPWVRWALVCVGTNRRVACRHCTSGPARSELGRTPSSLDNVLPARLLLLVREVLVQVLLGMAKSALFLLALVLAATLVHAQTNCKQSIKAPTGESYDISSLSGQQCASPVTLLRAFSSAFSACTSRAFFLIRAGSPRTQVVRATR